ncbi:MULTISPECIES: TlpA family protein disulfide reductase [Flavobacterium]|uniref:TlpA family protein disulfide reductase n=1 Tax=Flavobacterium TaxID=237 RepID=UPI001FCBF469|nr:MULTISPECIES: TlpA disulfide reductase family protein [Flavobacterium]UOK41702.1 TlpA family protein disulfide reductase [Flavobacterium enshiense]
MKAKFLIFQFIIISNFVLGQVPKKTIALEDKEFNSYFQNNKNIPVVKGKILNLTSEEINQVNIECSIVTPLGNLHEKKNYKLNADGTFEIKLDHALPYQQIWLSVGELFYTGLYANKDLYIELDAQILKSQKEAMFNGPGVKFLGKDGAFNAYMNNHILYIREKYFELSKGISELSSKKLEVPIYVKKYDSIYTAINKLDDEFIKQNPSNFSWMIKNESQSEYYGGLCVYFWSKQMPAELFEKMKNHKAYLTSNNGMLFYNYFLTYLETSGNKKKPAGIARATTEKIKMLDSLFAPSKSDFLKIKFMSKDPIEQKEILETVLPSIKTDWCKTLIQDSYSTTLEKLASLNKTLKESKPIVSDSKLDQPIGELPFGAKLYKVDSLNAKTLLTNLKNSFQGKALYIDMWATWCAPCIGQFPYSKRLHEETKSLPVEFVYLCTSEGSDIEKWQTKIVEFQLSGTHIFVAKEIENELMEMFSASGFPTYILINKEGECKPGIGRPSSLDKDKLAEWIN